MDRYEESNLFTENKTVIPELLEALERGVHWDVGHGTVSFSFENEKDAIHILKIPTEEKERLAQLKALIPKVAAKYNIPVIAGTQRTLLGHDRHALTGYLYKHAHQGLCVILLPGSSFKFYNQLSGDFLLKVHFCGQQA